MFSTLVQGGLCMWEKYVSFTQTIFWEMGVDARVIVFPYISDQLFDHGLRQALYTRGNDFTDFRDKLPEALRDANRRYLLWTHTDRYGCEYYALRLPKEESMLLIGPFGYTPYDKIRIASLMNDAQIPEYLSDFMEQYYASLPVVANEKWLQALIFTLAKNLYPEEMIQVYRFKPTGNFDQSYPVEAVHPSADTLAYMEKKYECEDAMMYDIAAGNLEKIEQICSHLTLSAIRQKLPESLRGHKNNLVIFSTLCRKAAQYGGVHPVYLDLEFGKIAQRIENAVSLSELEAIYRNIPRRYCMLVRTYSVKEYSPSVQKIVMYIEFHMEEKLSLQQIAEQFSLNKNYLSTLFKKNTGKCLTDYIRERRIERAIILLNTTSFSIQKIADNCGFQDLNYFSRVFREQIGMSPSSYRKQLKGE